MAKFKRRIDWVEAEQYVHGGHVPAGVRPCSGTHGHVITDSGDVEVSNGDWVVTTTGGARYVYSPDEFALKYEAAE